MKRGEIVTVSAPEDYGKPRPAVVIQSDMLAASDSVLVCLMTSTIVDAPFYRLAVPPDETNGLKAVSQIMIDKIIAMPREKCGAVIGRLEPAAVVSLGSMLSLIIGLVD